MAAEEVTDASVYCKRGYNNYCQKNYPEAIDDFTKAIDLRPECASAYYNRAIIYFLRGQNIEALADITKAEHLGLPRDRMDLNIRI